MDNLHLPVKSTGITFGLNLAGCKTYNSET